MPGDSKNPNAVKIGHGQLFIVIDIYPASGNISGNNIFPRGAGPPKQLRLQLREKDTDKVINLNFSL